MNANQVVNTPKKSNNIAIIIGVIVLVCCVCCVFIIFRGRSRSSTKSADIIVKDMEVETITSTPSTDSSTSTSTGGDDPKPLSTKPMKVQLYKTYDCSGEPIDAVSLNSVPLETEVKIDKRDKGDEYFACCMKTENAGVHATYTTGGSEKEEHTLNIEDGNNKIILTKDHKPPDVSNEQVQCAQNLYIKTSPLK